MNNLFKIIFFILFLWLSFRSKGELSKKKIIFLHFFTLSFTIIFTCLIFFLDAEIIYDYPLEFLEPMMKIMPIISSSFVNRSIDFPAYISISLLFALYPLIILLGLNKILRNIYDIKIVIYSCLASAFLFAFILYVFVGSLLV